MVSIARRGRSPFQRRVVFGVSLGSTHIADLRWFALLWVGFAAALFIVGVVLAKDVITETISAEVGAVFQEFMTFLAAVLGASGAAVKWAFDKANVRMGVVDKFEADIFSLCSAIYSLDLVRRYAALWAHPNLEEGAKLLPGSEDYTTLFKTCGTELGELQPDVIQPVTSFYTYFLASREAAAQLRRWDVHTDHRICRKDVVDVVVQLALCLTKAAQAGRALAEVDRFQTDTNVNKSLAIIDGMLADARRFLAGKVEPGELEALGLA